MAENQAVWGIDIGQAGLKAIRLRYAEAAEQVLAVAFDYVPHAKILSQPDAIPEELVRKALETFLSRNDLGNDLVSISVPGQSALARFIQLPPVESSKVAEIVKYEARQQIPFALEDVIWDYQPLGGGVEESGFMLDAEVGLFAMKRDDVLRHLNPFTEQKVEVELVQVAPLALYNFLCYDRLGVRPGVESEPADDYTIVLDMGSDNTTLLVSNGVKIWIRNVPLGGNHFTRALTKEMKLTFAKAEHLKCNATRSPDPRAVFQAMRPVFNDYVAEIQRSIGYFSSVNRDAKIGRVLGVGNGFKLAGLQKFLQQNLQYDVERVDGFKAVVGDAVLGAQLFEENLLSFVVPYGLALQTLELTRIHTSLLPPEIATARMIRRKKPWAVTAAASLLFGLAMSATGYSHVLQTVGTERWEQAEKKADDTAGHAGTLQSNYTTEVNEYTSLKEAGEQLVGNLSTREYWMEIYKAIDDCLPRDVGDDKDITELKLKNRINVKSITAKRYSDLSLWYQGELSDTMKQTYMRPADQENPPSGVGYVFTLNCVHYHDDPKNAATGQGMGYVMDTLLKNLKSWEVNPPGSSQPTPTPVRKMGITHPVITRSFAPVWIDFWPQGRPGGGQSVGPMPRGFAGGGFGPGRGLMPSSRSLRSGPGMSRTGPPGVPPQQPGQATDPDGIGPEKVRKTEFVIQFAWHEVPPSERPDVDPEAPAPDANALGDPNNPAAPAATNPAVQSQPADPNAGSATP